MTPIDDFNPFMPGDGQLPPYLAGREDDHAQSDILVITVTRWKREEIKTTASHNPYGGFMNSSMNSRTKNRTKSSLRGMRFLLLFLPLLLTALPALPQAQTSFGKDDASSCYQASQLPRSGYGLRYCTRAIRKDDLLGHDLAATYTNRGIIYSAIGKLDAALEDFNQALELTTKTANIYINRGNTFQRLREYEKALADYDRALAPFGVALDSLYYNRALALIRLKRWDEARTALKNALQANPQAERIKRTLDALDAPPIKTPESL